MQILNYNLMRYFYTNAVKIMLLKLDNERPYYEIEKKNYACSILIVKNLPENYVSSSSNSWNYIYFMNNFTLFLNILIN